MKVLNLHIDKELDIDLTFNCSGIKSCSGTGIRSCAKQKSMVVVTSSEGGHNHNKKSKKEWEYDENELDFGKLLRDLQDLDIYDDVKGLQKELFGKLNSKNNFLKTNQFLYKQNT